MSNSLFYSLCHRTLFVEHAPRAEGRTEGNAISNVTMKVRQAALEASPWNIFDVALSFDTDWLKRHLSVFGRAEAELIKQIIIVGQAMGLKDLAVPNNVRYP